MHRFVFTLQIPGGATVVTQAVALRWQWSLAFAEACRNVEERMGLPPFAGISCREVTVHPVEERRAA